MRLCKTSVNRRFVAASTQLMVLCRTYLRHQIRQYLYRHADMPPKAIVLVALLVPEEPTADHTSTSDSDPARHASHSSCALLPDASVQFFIAIVFILLPSFHPSFAHRALTMLGHQHHMSHLQRTQNSKSGTDTALVGKQGFHSHRLHANQRMLAPLSSFAHTVMLLAAKGILRHVHHAVKLTQRLAQAGKQKRSSMRYWSAQWSFHLQHLLGRDT